MPQVKICGLCRPEDAIVAVEAGADLAGVVLDAGTHRSQTVESAAAILDGVPAARRVGVMVDASGAAVRRAVERLGLAVIQLHGAEPLAFVRALREDCGVSIWKAVRPRTLVEAEAAVEAWAGSVDALLLDGWSDVAAGGTGTRFDWSVGARVRAILPAPARLVAAGGLTPDNVASLVEAVRPDIVDVSSGVEAVPGRKDRALMERFIAAARTVRAGPADPES
jgi:phosphoribosylanthranilate isomerase